MDRMCIEMMTSSRSLGIGLFISPAVPFSRRPADRREHATNKTVYGAVLYPAGHDHEVVFRVYVDDVRAVADVREGRGGRARQVFPFGVEEEVHETVGGLRGRGRRRHVQPPL